MSEMTIALIALFASVALLTGTVTSAMLGRIARAQAAFGWDNTTSRSDRRRNRVWPTHRARIRSGSPLRSEIARGDESSAAAAGDRRIPRLQSGACVLVRRDRFTALGFVIVFFLAGEPWFSGSRAPSSAFYSQGHRLAPDHSAKAADSEWPAGRAGPAHREPRGRVLRWTRPFRSARRNWRWPTQRFRTSSG